MLYNCINNIEKEMQSIFSKTQETKMCQIKAKQRLIDLNKVFNFICEKVDEYEGDWVEKEKFINELLKNVSDKSATIESLKGYLDRQDQYLRNSCLLIYGLSESKNKNTMSC